MLITIRAEMPMSDAQGVKESVAMRLEDMAPVVRVVAIEDDGFGQQMAINESKPASAGDSWGDFRETKACYERMMKRRGAK